MNTDIKQRWVEALRSGDFKQCYHAYALGDDRLITHHSPVSILAHILMLPREPLYSGTKIDWVVVDSQYRPVALLPLSTFVEIDLQPIKANYVNWLSHKLRWNFNQIAEWIERNL